MPSAADLEWWKNSTVYQILTATFKDSNGDGVGDIPGIISKLDYIQSLGMDAIWLCPMYDGPQVDLGYDVSDYQNVYPPYGTLTDMENLIKECHDRKMRIMLDLVISHTSNQHPWFLESKSSKDNAKRDWYIWRPAKHDEDGNRIPPNNWKSVFGEESAWEWDPSTEEYYLHFFTKEQPDLNWEREETRKALFENAIVFWLEKGVDAFRLDAANMYSKPEGLVDAPVTNEGEAYQPATQLCCNGPRIHEYLLEVREVFERYGAVSAGEIPFTCGREEVLPYVSGEGKQLDVVFQFDVVGVGMGGGRKYDVEPRDWTLPDLKSAFSLVQDTLKNSDAWTAIFLESHDQGRSISRFGNDKPEHRVVSGKLLSMMLATLSGTLFVYQGQELGMVNVPDDFPVEEMEDPESGLYYKFIQERSGEDQDEMARAARAVRYLSRFNARMPMAWDGNAEHAGFSSVEPQTKLHPMSGEINVAWQEGDSDSVLSFWKRMLQLRKEHAEVLVHGEFVPLHLDHPSLFVYLKQKEDHKVLVVLNFSEEENADWTDTLDGEFDLDKEDSELLISNLGKDGLNYEVLRPLEGRVYCGK